MGMLPHRHPHPTTWKGVTLVLEGKSSQLPSRQLEFWVRSKAEELKEGRCQHLEAFAPLNPDMMWDWHSESLLHPHLSRKQEQLSYIPSPYLPNSELLNTRCMPGPSLGTQAKSPAPWSWNRSRLSKCLWTTVHSSPQLYSQRMSPAHSHALLWFTVQNNNFWKPVSMPSLLLQKWFPWILLQSLCIPVPML